MRVPPRVAQPSPSTVTSTGVRPIRRLANSGMTCLLQRETPTDPDHSSGARSKAMPSLHHRHPGKAETHGNDDLVRPEQSRPTVTQPWASRSAIDGSREPARNGRAMDAADTINGRAR